MSAVAVPGCPEVAQFWMYRRHNSERRRLSVTNTRAQANGCVFARQSGATEQKHNKQTLQSFFGHEAERKKAAARLHLQSDRGEAFRGK